MCVSVWFFFIIYIIFFYNFFLLQFFTHSYTNTDLVTYHMMEYICMHSSIRNTTTVAIFKFRFTCECNRNDNGFFMSYISFCRYKKRFELLLEIPYARTKNMYAIYSYMFVFVRALWGSLTK